MAEPVHPGRWSRSLGCQGLGAHRSGEVAFIASWPRTPKAVLSRKVGVTSCFYLIVANTHEGLAARARGRTGGRARKLSAAQAKDAQDKYDSRAWTVQQIADLYGVPRSTVYGYLTNPGSLGEVLHRRPHWRPRAVDQAQVKSVRSVNPGEVRPVRTARGGWVRPGGEFTHWPPTPAVETSASVPAGSSRHRRRGRPGASVLSASTSASAVSSPCWSGSRRARCSSSVSASLPRTRGLGEKVTL